MSWLVPTLRRNGDNLMERIRRDAMGRLRSGSLVIFFGQSFLFFFFHLSAWMTDQHFRAPALQLGNWRIQARLFIFSLFLNLPTTTFAFFSLLSPPLCGRDLCQNPPAWQVDGLGLFFSSFTSTLCSGHQNPPA